MRKKLLLSLMNFALLSIATSSVYAEREDHVGTIGDTAKYGEWGDWEHCPEDSFATGYSMKVERSLGGDSGFTAGVADIFDKKVRDDDTAVNAIRLICMDRQTRHKVDEITSSEGEYGIWQEGALCSKAALKSFNIKIEQPQGSEDDTSVNSIKFKCADGEPITATGEMPWGDWKNYIDCPDKEVLGIKFRTAICGIQTRVEPPQGDGDDTGLNGVNFACCAFETQGN